MSTDFVRSFEHKFLLIGKNIWHWNKPAYNLLWIMNVNFYKQISHKNIYLILYNFKPSKELVNLLLNIFALLWSDAFTRARCWYYA